MIDPCFVGIGAGLAVIAGGTLGWLEWRSAQVKLDGEAVGLAITF